MSSLIRQYIKKELPSFFFSVVFAICATVCYLLLGQQMSKIIDSAAETHFSLLITHTVITVLVCLALLLVDVAEKYFRQQFVMTIGNHIRRDALQALFHMPAVDRRKESHDYYFHAITNDVDLFMERYLDSLLTATRRGLSAIAIGVVLCFFDYRLFFLSLLFAFLPSVIGDLFVKPTKQINQERSKAGECYYSILHEALHGLSIIKRSGHQNKYFLSIERILETWGDKTNRMEVLRIFAQRTMWTVNSIGQILVIMICSYLIMQGKMTTGALLAAIYYVTFFAENVTNAYFNFMEIRAAEPIKEKVLRPIVAYQESSESRTE